MTWMSAEARWLESGVARVQPHLDPRYAPPAPALPARPRDAQGRPRCCLVASSQAAAEHCVAVVSDGAVLVRAVLPLLPQQLPPPGTVLELTSYEWEWDQFAGREELEREAAQARPWSRVLDAPAELFLLVRGCCLAVSQSAAALAGAERPLAFSAPARHPRHRVSMAVRAMCAGSMVLPAWRPRAAAREHEWLEGDRAASQERPGWDEELVGPAQTLALWAPRDRESDRECERAEAGAETTMLGAALPAPPAAAALSPGRDLPPHQQHQQLSDGGKLSPHSAPSPSALSRKRCSQDEAVTADLEEQLAVMIAERNQFAETCAQLRARCREYELEGSRLSADKRAAEEALAAALAGKQAADEALATALAGKQAADEALATALADKAELAARCTQLAASQEAAVAAAREEGEREGWKALEELNEVRDRYNAALAAATAAAAAATAASATAAAASNSSTATANNKKTATATATATATTTTTTTTLADERQWKRDLAGKDQQLALKDQQLARAEETLSKLRYSHERVCAREADARKEISRLLDEDRVRVEVEHELEARNAQIKKLQLRLQKKCEALRQAEAQAGRRPRQPEDDEDEDERARKLPASAPPAAVAPARGAPPAPEPAGPPAQLSVGNLAAYWAARLRESGARAATPPASGPAQMRERP
jgi:hypothetical protein